jgi:hypothetical protein
MLIIFNLKFTFPTGYEKCKVPKSGRGYSWTVYKTVREEVNSSDVKRHWPSIEAFTKAE